MGVVIAGLVCLPLGSTAGLTIGAPVHASFATHFAIESATEMLLLMPPPVYGITKSRPWFLT